MKARITMTLGLLGLLTACFKQTEMSPVEFEP
jgi:hypothetical protein